MPAARGECAQGRFGIVPPHRVIDHVHAPAGELLGPEFQVFLAVENDFVGPLLAARRELLRT